MGGAMNGASGDAAARIHNIPQTRARPIQSHQMLIACQRKGIIRGHYLGRFRS
jgi:hypothetical protein